MGKDIGIKEKLVLGIEGWQLLIYLGGKSTDDISQIVDIY